MANLRLSFINSVDAAVLTGSDTPLAPFPLSSLTKTGRDTNWRSSTLNTQVLQGTWNGDGFAPGMFGLFRHNAHGGSIRIQLYSDAAWTTQVYDSGTNLIQGIAAIDAFAWGVDPLGIVGSDPLVLESPYILYFTPVTCASFRVTLSGSGGEGKPYWQAGRMWLATYMEATYNPAMGLGLTYVDNTDSGRMLGGSLRSNIGAKWRKMDVDMQWISEAQRSTWLDIMGKAQRASDVVVSLFPGVGGRLERDYTINGKFVALDPISYANFAYRSKKFSVEEL